MKGFAITPILLVALILITAVLMINFIDLDKRIAEGISAEARLKRLASEANENEISAYSAVLWQSVEAAKECAAACTATDLENKIKIRMGIAPPETLSVGPCGGQKKFQVDYSSIFSGSVFDSKISRDIKVSKIVDCSAIQECSSFQCK